MWQDLLAGNLRCKKSEPRLYTSIVKPGSGQRKSRQDRSRRLCFVRHYMLGVRFEQVFPRFFARGTDDPYYVTHITTSRITFLHTLDRPPGRATCPAERGGSSKSAGAGLEYDVFVALG